MAAYYPSRSTPLDIDFASSVQRIFVTLRDWNDARLTRKALNKLSARELLDIGLIPADIDAVARGTYRR